MYVFALLLLDIKCGTVIQLYSSALSHVMKSCLVRDYVSCVYVCISKYIHVWLVFVYLSAY